jgi:peptide chain release factor 2
MGSFSLLLNKSYNIVMKNLIDKLTGIQFQIDQAIKNLFLDQERARLAELEEAMASPDLWNDQTRAESITKEASSLKQYLESWDNIAEDIKTTLELLQLEKDGKESDYELVVDDLAERAQKLLVAVKLNGEHDKLPAIVQISAGVGGTDAADWAGMLERMYLRYGEISGLTTEVLDESPAEEAGIKSATIRFSGPFAFGKLRSEKGVHRLVRLSPFNSDNLRQTSFALVDVIPELPESDSQISEKDLKIDTYRSSGHGGQSVNTTDSAVRITHLPTGLVVAIQSERSQLKNKQRAMSILASRLAELAREQHLDSISELKATKSADWGSQIRSYVLHPYQKVKDHRSGFETSDTQGVLDGNIEPLIEAYLNSQVGKD